MAEGPVDHPEKEAIPNFAEQVFKIHLLREMILDKVIRENKKTCWSSVRTLRLIQKSWHETTSKLLEKHKIPIFDLGLDSTNSLNDNVGPEGKLLDQFTSAVMSCSLSTGPTVPLFNVLICPSVFVEENHEGLSNLLVHCGAGMTELKLYLDDDAISSLKLMFPSFSLPNLRKLVIDPMGFRRSDNVSHFINSLLNAAPSLERFVVDYNDNCDIENGVLDFQFFTLPPSITTLELGCDLTIANLEGLLKDKNRLPLLSSLTLLIPNKLSYPEGLLFRMLDKFRGILLKLTLDYRCHVQLEAASKLRFPIMEKLEELSNLSINCVLEDDTSSLEGFLPKLSKLALTNQTTDMFSKWTDNSRLASVEDLELHLANAMVPERDNIHYWVGVNLERMQRVHLTFPNVSKLDVTVNASETCGLKYLFMEMRQLTELKIKAVSYPLTWNVWDAVFIGAPEKFVEALRESRELWSKVHLAADDSPPSIRNLQELTSLSLGRHPYGHSTPTISRISDLTFHFALLQMPKLQELTLGGEFRASEEMATKWRSEGRTLVHSFD